MRAEIDRSRMRFKELEYPISLTLHQKSYLVAPAQIDDSQDIRLIVFMGGNGMTAFDGIMWFMELRPYIESPTVKYAFLAVEYPGYGSNEGNPSPQSIHDSTVSAFDSALRCMTEEWDMRPVDMTVIGHSLGSAVATRWVASGGSTKSIPVRKLILSAPFTSIADMASHIFGVPRLLSPLISRHNWDTVKELKSVIESDTVQEMIRIIHGTEDEIVPFRMGVELSKIDAGKIQLVPLKNMMHNNILDSYKVYAYAISE